MLEGVTLLLLVVLGQGPTPLPSRPRRRMRPLLPRRMHGLRWVLIVALGELTEVYGLDPGALATATVASPGGARSRTLNTISSFSLLWRNIVAGRLFGCTFNLSLRNIEGRFGFAIHLLNLLDIG